MNILVAVNQDYLEQLKVLLYSISKNNKCKLHVFLMSSRLESTQIQNLKEFVQNQCRGILQTISVDKDFLKDAKVLSHFSTEMYYRIFASLFLPEDMDRILWLDADIVVNGSLEEFYHSDFQGKSMIACTHREKDEKIQTATLDARKRLGLKEKTEYFNSGVILFNLKKIRHNFCEEDVLKLIRKYSEVLLYPDQDILNILYEGDTLYADKSVYNYQIHFDWECSGEQDFIERKVRILHYVGPMKPWIYKSSHFSYEYYWKYYLESGGSKRKYYKWKIMSVMYQYYRKLRGME